MLRAQHEVHLPSDVQITFLGEAEAVEVGLERRKGGKEEGRLPNILPSTKISYDFGVNTNLEINQVHQRQPKSIQ